jgi:hypothetical protein
MTQATNSPKRRWFQFSVRELLMLTLIVALAVYLVLQQREHAAWQKVNDGLLEVNTLMQQKIAQQQRTMDQRVKAGVEKRRVQMKALFDAQVERLKAKMQPAEEVDSTSTPPHSDAASHATPE